TSAAGSPASGPSRFLQKSRRYCVASPRNVPAGFPSRGTSPSIARSPKLSSVSCRAEPQNGCGYPGIDGGGTCDEEHPEARDQEEARGIHGRGTGRDEGAHPGDEGGRGGRGKRRDG